MLLKKDIIYLQVIHHYSWHFLKVQMSRASQRIALIVHKDDMTSPAQLSFGKQSGELFMSLYLCIVPGNVQ